MENSGVRILSLRTTYGGARQAAFISLGKGCVKGDGVRRLRTTCEYRYTGHIKGTEEVYAKTPIAMQLECAEPEPQSFIYTRTAAPPRAMPDRDPCNKPENAKKPQPSMIHHGSAEIML